jgi:hypothetical protein
MKLKTEPGTAVIGDACYLCGFPFDTHDPVYFARELTPYEPFCSRECINSAIESGSYLFDKV